MLAAVLQLVRSRSPVSLQAVDNEAPLELRMLNPTYNAYVRYLTDVENCRAASEVLRKKLVHGAERQRMLVATFQGPTIVQDGANAFCDRGSRRVADSGAARYRALLNEIGGALPNADRLFDLVWSKSHAPVRSSHFSLTSTVIAM